MSGNTYNFRCLPSLIKRGVTSGYTTVSPESLCFDFDPTLEIDEMAAMELGWGVTDGWIWYRNNNIQN